MPLMTEAESDKAYASACDAIQNRVKGSIGPKCVVYFSAYTLDEDQVPVDNLDEVPVTGKLLVRGSRLRGGQRGTEYESCVLENPSWLDLCGIANDQIIATRDREHRYLEGIEVVENNGDVQLTAFRLGA
jgi:hypothetical protein